MCHWNAHDCRLPRSHRHECVAVTCGCVLKTAVSERMLFWIYSSCFRWAFAHKHVRFVASFWASVPGWKKHCHLPWLKCNVKTRKSGQKFEVSWNPTKDFLANPIGWEERQLRIENPAKAFLANPIGWNENQLRTLKITLRLSWQILKSRMKTH